MLFPADQLAENAPDTWQVVKIADRVWTLQSKDGVTIATKTTRKACEQLKTEGHVVTLYAREVAWVAGETPRGWRPYAEVKADDERRAARWAQLAVPVV